MISIPITIFSFIKIIPLAWEYFFLAIQELDKFKFIVFLTFFHSIQPTVPFFAAFPDRFHSLLHLWPAIRM